ncbi:hypothetical protein Dimus_035567 [Dionaea muscipula]
MKRAAPPAVRSTSLLPCVAMREHAWVPTATAPRVKNETSPDNGHHRHTRSMSMAGSGPVLRPAGWRAVELVDVHPPLTVVGCGRSRRRGGEPSRRREAHCGQDSSRVVSPCSRRPACGMASSGDGTTSGSEATASSEQQRLRATTDSGRRRLGRVIPGFYGHFYVY